MAWRYACPDGLHRTLAHTPSCSRGTPDAPKLPVLCGRPRIRESLPITVRKREDSAVLLEEVDDVRDVLVDLALVCARLETVRICKVVT
jgi:hypothetical protein